MLNIMVGTFALIIGFTALGTGIYCINSRQPVAGLFYAVCGLFGLGVALLSFTNTYHHFF